MVHVRTHSPMAWRIMLGCVLIVGIVVGGSVTPHTFAAGSRAAVTTSTVAYHLAAQVVSGPTAGSMIAGQVSGTLDSTGMLTATLTLTNGATSTVTGTLAAPAQITIKGSAGNLTLSGSLLNKKAGIWGGMITQAAGGDTGSWMLIPEPQSLTFSLGGKSSATSKDKLALAGQLTLSLTSAGWGEGTFAFLNNNTVLQAEGQVANGNLRATIYWPHKGTVLLVATGKPIIGVTKWTGTFVGPALNDVGTFIGEG
jgi:hypothetical protein